MQLKMPFLETDEPPPTQSPTPANPPSTAWDSLDETARIAALGVLTRLIARMLAAKPAGGMRHD